jgi:hypothetical protein
VRLPTVDEIEQSSWCLSAQMLCDFAQRGLAATDWGDVGLVQDAMISVLPALTSTPMMDSGFGGDAIDELHSLADPETELGCVLLAAHARQSLSGYAETVSARELAALASISVRYVRGLGQEGLLALDDGEVPIADARRWLESRGIALDPMRMLPEP